MTLTRQLVGLAVSIGTCFAVAAVGSAMTIPSIDTWYAPLTKPSWSPPNWVFGPVWSTLYLCMAVAAWMVWRERGLSAARIRGALRLPARLEWRMVRLVRRAS